MGDRVGPLQSVAVSRMTSSLPSSPASSIRRELWLAAGPRGSQNESMEKTHRMTWLLLVSAQSSGSHLVSFLLLSPGPLLS